MVIGEAIGSIRGGEAGALVGTPTGEATGMLFGAIVGTVTGDVTGEATGILIGAIVGTATGGAIGSTTGGYMHPSSPCPVPVIPPGHTQTKDPGVF
jgi:hypothetical protein